MTRTAAQAIDQVLGSGLHGHAHPTRLDIDLVVSASGLLPPSASSASKARLASALAWALGRSGRPRDALTIADRKAMSLLARAASEAEPAKQSDGYAALAETYLLHGRLADAAICAQFSADYARLGSSGAHELRAIALLAAAEALNGEFASAGGHLGSAQDLDQGRGRLCSSWPMAVAVTQIGFRTGNFDQARCALETLSAAAADPVERTVARLCESWIQAADGDHKAVLTTIDALTRRVDAQQVPPFLIDLAVSIKSLALAQLGQPGAVLNLINHRSSPPDHPVCFEVQSATAYLQLGDPRKALAVTEACLAGCPNHSLRTYPSVLLRRAVAHEMLGHHDLADADFSQATRLAVELAGVRPALGLPQDVLKELYTRLLANERDLGKVVTQRIPSTAHYTSPEPVPFEIGSLSARERVLGAWLATDLTFTAIAAELHVSGNTVKTQAKSLYRKLGAATRQDAVARLERVGLYLSGYRDEPSNSQT